MVWGANTLPSHCRNRSGGLEAPTPKQGKSRNVNNMAKVVKFEKLLKIVRARLRCSDIPASSLVSTPVSPRSLLWWLVQEAKLL